MTDLPPYPDGFPPPYPDPTVPAGPMIRPSVPTQPTSDAGYPQPGYLPPGYPESAYPAPGYPDGGYQRTGYPPPGYPASPYGFAGMPGFPGMAIDPALANDLLVTPPGQGFGGWWTRMWKTFARGWRQLLVVVALTSSLPALALVIVDQPLNGRTNDLLQPAGKPADGGQVRAVVVLLVLLLAVLIVSVFSSAIGWSAAIWTITKQAVGEPAPFGAAMAFGARNCLRVAGWLVLYGLMIAGGVVACVIPGLYFALAGCLVIPVAIFRRGLGIGESFRIVNANFGSVLGRAATLVGLVVAVDLVTAPIRLVVGPDVVSTIIGTVCELPINVVTIIGITLIYAEMVARQQPLNSAGLNSVL